MKISMWISLCKNYLQNQEPMATQFITSRTALYTTGIVMLNEAVAHIFYIYFLFLNQSWSTIKKIAAMNVMSLNEINIHSLPSKFLFILRIVRVLVSSWLKPVVLLADFIWSRYKGRQERNNSQNLQNFLVFHLEWLWPCSYLRYIIW